MSYEDNAIRIERTRYFLPAIEIKYYNVINDGKNALITRSNPKATQQINFTENLDQDGGTTMSSVIEEVKETILHFSQEIVKVL